MTNDMTKGSPLKLILMFMIPACLGNIFQQLYNLADLVIAGRFLGVNALAAVGSTGSLIFFVIGWLNGLTSGFAILVAQSFGAKNYDRMRHYMAMSVYLCTAFVIVMTVALLFANYPILRLIRAPEEIIDDVAAYMAIIYAGLAITAAYNALAAVLRALGDSISPLIFLMISAVINVFLDIAFIVWGGMGVEGCAYATVIAQGVSVVLCLVYIKLKYDILKLKKADFEFSFRTIAQLLNMGIPMGLQFSITAIGTIIVQGAINSLGAVYIAAFSAAGKIQNVIATVFMSLGATVATFVGQNYGAGRFDRVRQGVRTTEWIVLAWAAIIYVAVTFFGRAMTTAFVSRSETAVLDGAELYFKMVAWCYPFLGSIFVYRNALQGMGFGVAAMMGGVFELVARAAVVVLLVGPLGYRGVCLADPAAWLAALIPLVPFYYYQERKISSNLARNNL